MICLGNLKKWLFFLCHRFFFSNEFVPADVPDNIQVPAQVPVPLADLAANASVPPTNYAANHVVPSAVKLPPAFSSLKITKQFIEAETNSSASFQKADQMFSFGNTYLQAGPIINGRGVDYKVKSAETDKVYAVNIRLKLFNVI